MSEQELFENLANAILAFEKAHPILKVESISVKHSDERPLMLTNESQKGHIWIRVNFEGTKFWWSEYNKELNISNNEDN